MHGVSAPELGALSRSRRATGGKAEGVVKQAPSSAENEAAGEIRDRRRRLARRLALRFPLCGLRASLHVSYGEGCRSRPMIDVQVVLNGLVLGGLYACVRSVPLVWGVLNVINLLHGSLIVLGAYLPIGPLPSRTASVSGLPLVATILLRARLSAAALRHQSVMAAPVLITLVLTFGLDLLLYNALVLCFTATPRRILLNLGRSSSPT